jgi:hypothetical protein
VGLAAPHASQVHLSPVTLHVPNVVVSFFLLLLLLLLMQHMVLLVVAVACQLLA